MRRSGRQIQEFARRVWHRFSLEFWLWSAVLVGGFIALDICIPGFRQALEKQSVDAGGLGWLLETWAVGTGFIGGLFLKGKLEPALLLAQVLLMGFVAEALAGPPGTLISKIVLVIIMFALASWTYAAMAVPGIVAGWIVRFLHRGITAMLLQDEKERLKG